MPILDRQRRRLPKLGIIRLGHLETRKRKDGSEYTFPVQDDHFVLRDAPQLAKYFADRGIDKPRELDVILPFPNIHDNYDASYAVWANGVLLCRGDGERVLYANPMRVTEDNKGHVHVYNEAGPTLVADGVAQCGFHWGEIEYVPGQIVPCPGSNVDLGHPHCPACRMSAILKVTPYDDEIFAFGFLQLTTGSWRNHQTIMGTLESLPPGALESHLPFTLRMVEESTIYQDAEGKRKSTKRWFLQLMPHPDKLKALFLRQTQHYIEGRADPAALPATVDYEAEPTAPPPYAEREAWERARETSPHLEGGVQDGEWEGVAQWPAEGQIPQEEETWPDELPPEAPAETPPEAPPDLPEKESAKESAPPPPAPSSARPYDPETLKEKLRGVIAKKRHQGKASVPMIGLCRALLKQVFPTQSEVFMPRLLGYLVDKKSLDECSGKEVAGLIDWLKDDEASGPGNAVVHQEAIAEAQAVVRHAYAQEGQEMLPGLET